MALFDPAHPGELIRETLEGLREETGQKLTIAEGLGTTRKMLSSIINGKQSISPEMAISLSIVFPNTSVEFWLKVQESYNFAKIPRVSESEQIKLLG